jgi:hypothetical protein
VDLGTAFGVRVHPRGASEVGVFAGRVVIRDAAGKDLYALSAGRRLLLRARRRGRRVSLRFAADGDPAAAVCGAGADADRLALLNGVMLLGTRGTVSEEAPPRSGAKPTASCNRFPLRRTPMCSRTPGRQYGRAGVALAQGLSRVLARGVPDVCASRNGADVRGGEGLRAALSDRERRGRLRRRCALVFCEESIRRGTNGG